MPLVSSCRPPHPNLHEGKHCKHQVDEDKDFRKMLRKEKVLQRELGNRRKSVKQYIPSTW